MLPSSPESGARAGYSGYKRRNGSKAHAAVDTLGHLLALTVTPANEDERTQVTALATQIQAVTGDTVELASVDSGDTGDAVAATAAAQGIHLAVVALSEAKRGFVLLPRRWGVERSFAWTARFRRLARDYERLPSVLAGLHFLVFACLLLHQMFQFYSSSLQALRVLVRLNDRVAAVRVCYEIFAAKDAGVLCRKIDGIFDSQQPDVLLSTIHRAKGLEAKRIFQLNPDEMPLKWPNQQAWELEQEYNIKYVALTRAKQELYLVKSPAS